MNWETQKKLYEEKFKQMNKGGTNTNNLDKFVRLEDGTTIVRILPAINEEEPFFLEVSNHRMVDADGKNRVVECRRKHDEECPLCDLYYALWEDHRKKVGRNSKEETPESALARTIRPNNRYFMNVYMRDTGEVKILSVAKTLFQSILGKILDKDYPDLLSVTNGYDYKIIRKTPPGKFSYPNYNESTPRPKPEPLAKTEGEIHQILSKRHDLTVFSKLEDYDSVRELAEYAKTTLYKTKDNTPKTEDDIENLTQGEL